MGFSLVFNSFPFLILARFETHAIASLALQKSHGKPLTGVAHTGNRAEVMSVEFDGEKDKLGKFLKEKEEERKEKEKRRRDAEKGRSVGVTSHTTSQRMPNGNTTPSSFTFSKPPPNAATSRTNSTSNANAHAGPSTPTHTPSTALPAPISPARIRRPPAALVKARLNTALSLIQPSSSQNGSTAGEPASDSGNPPPWLNHQYLSSLPPKPAPYTHTPSSQHYSSLAPLMPMSNQIPKWAVPWTTGGQPPRTPSPTPSHAAKLGIHTSPGFGVHVSPGKGKARDEGVEAELARSAFDHVKVDAAGLGVTEAEIRSMFSGFDVDKVMSPYSILKGHV